nr:UDP-glucuronate 4-epimerase 3-like [Tanacetum cinerariifolium]
RRGDGVLGLDNFNDYYEPSLKRARQALQERSGVYVVEGLRFFTVYGPWGRPDMAYFFFTKDILKGKPIPIFEGANHGTVARDFTYIDDIVKGCLGALDTAEKSTGSDLVSILERLLKVKAKRMVMKLPRNGDVQFTHANISLAKREFGYKPTTDLQTGLKKFVRCNIQIANSAAQSNVHWMRVLQSVDEDEEQVEEEFKEEEDPQEEEDDMEVDIDEDENELELTCPYEEVDPFKPLPPASESEPEDVTEAENLIE